MRFRGRVRVRVRVRGRCRGRGRPINTRGYSGFAVVECFQPKKFDTSQVKSYYVVMDVTDVDIPLTSNEIKSFVIRLAKYCGLKSMPQSGTMEIIIQDHKPFEIRPHSKVRIA